MDLKAQTLEDCSSTGFAAHLAASGCACVAELSPDAMHLHLVSAGALCPWNTAPKQEVGDQDPRPPAHAPGPDPLGAALWSLHAGLRVSYRKQEVPCLQQHSSPLSPSGRCSTRLPDTSANQQAKRSWLFAAAFAVANPPLKPFHLLFLSFAQMQYPEIRLQIKVLPNPEMGSNFQSQRDQCAATSPL